ncbi:hypothetical protein HAX54_049637 [Datura stramonium]|uniref:Uncharacterized protein n=1 Tax=Datura stramonium TaxID=4076 RepID=A0ABS8SW07_DATST|nr:hypothetical protein [Datura stramonium]
MAAINPNKVHALSRYNLLVNFTTHDSARQRPATNSQPVVGKSPPLPAISHRQSQSIELRVSVFPLTSQIFLAVAGCCCYFLGTWTLGGANC